MPHDVLAGFVNRERELDLFRHMLAGETAERILLVTDDTENGKTCLLLKISEECEGRRPAVPVALANFDERYGRGKTDYLGIARTVSRHLGETHTPAICACDTAIFGRGPLVSIQTGAGDARVDLGRRGRITETDISQIEGRDLIQVGDVYAPAAQPTAEQTVRQVAKEMADMGRALRDDLAQLAGTHARVVLLMDTFEYADREVCEWLETWLLEPMRRELAHILLVVAGQSRCHDFFEPPRQWSSLIAAIDRLTPFSDDDILAHYHQRNLPVSEAELPLLLELARPSPARMAQVGDWLRQTRGGGR